jgi:hypothetical protein
MQFIALFSKEQGLTNSFILEGSLLVIYNRYLFVLVILIIINIKTQLLIKILVYNFYLIICLQVICS